MDLIRDYGQDQELAKQFFRETTYVNDEGELVPKFNDTLTKLANREEILLTIDMNDLERFNAGLAEAVSKNTLRYVDIFYQALDELLPTYKTRDPSIKDIMDVFIEQRTFIANRNQNAQGLQSQRVTVSQDVPPANDALSNKFIDINGMHPPDLIRRAEINFKPASLQATPIRSVLADCIGKLVTVRGIVTRTTDVKPKISVACYTCDQCGFESFQVIKGMEFTPLFECTSAVCKANKVQGRVTMHNRGSKFVKFQEIKLQEHSDQVPTGHIPRAITIFAHGEQTRRCTPGDHISVSGVFLTIEKSGYRMKTGGLSADTYIEAHYITQMNKTEDDELNATDMSMEEANELVGGRPDFLNRLSSSLAPEIYGHADLKKALLLLLVGGVDRNPNGMKVRGNINICLMGDPGVAKSQMLGFIDRLASRSQYTTGRGSSGVGLTAAVMKDPITGELTLEGGALVLADEGICCIDEFDKMMDADRTAIHEVMEQQTVSIAKAGIMTTLNARVSILAAANPAYGRYNIHKNLTQNLDLPPALLSRFDLLWLIKDEPDSAKDTELASHVTSIHLNPDFQRVVDEDVIDMKTMRRYINLCKTKNPIVPPELDDSLVKIYLDIRSKDRKISNDSLFTSPRSLLAIIRMATAFARLRLSDEVEKADIEEALRLYNCSRESITAFQGESDAEKILEFLKTSIGSGSDSIDEENFLEIAVNRGFDSNAIQEALYALSAVETIAIQDGRIILLDTPMFS